MSEADGVPQSAVPGLPQLSALQLSAVRKWISQLNLIEPRLGLAAHAWLHGSTVFIVIVVAALAVAGFVMFQRKN